MTRDRSSHAAAGIDRAQVARAALDVVRRAGVDGLTMRAVAEELGVRAPTLYHWVAGKADLLALMARHAVSSLEDGGDLFADIPTVDSYIAAARRSVLMAREVYRTHPGLATLMLAQMHASRDSSEDARGRMVGSEIAALVRFGMTPVEARATFETLARWTLAACIAESLPHPHTEDDERRFVQGLDLLLDGFRRLMQETYGAG